MWTRFSFCFHLLILSLSSIVVTYGMVISIEIFFQVKVVLGDERENMGVLLSIDNQEGVVKIDGDDIKMLQLRYLCKMKS